MEKWRLQDAKKRFSEVVKRTREKGPQVVTRRGTETVVVISIEEYHRLTRPKTNLVIFFRQSPLFDSKIDLSRNKDLPREGEL